LPYRSSKTPAPVITSQLPHSEKLRDFRTDRLRGCTETFPESSPALRAIPASPATLAKPALQVHFRTVIRREVDLPDMPAPRNHNLKQTKRHFGTPPNDSGKEQRLSTFSNQKSKGKGTDTLCQILKAFSMLTSSRHDPAKPPPSHRIQDAYFHFKEKFPSRKHPICTLRWLPGTVEYKSIYMINIHKMLHKCYGIS